jgi:iron transport multicopper oxidase
VSDPDSPYAGAYDEELVLTMSDWYHKQVPELMKQFISYKNPTGAEPVPQAALFNDNQNTTLAVEPGKTYLVRMINIAAFAAQYVWFEEHTMRVVEVDGVYVEPKEAEMLYITAAQRVSVLITTKNDTTANYAFMGSMDEDLFDKVPSGLNPNVTGWLVYDSSLSLPAAKPVDAFNPLDDITLVPVDGEALLPEPDHVITLEVMMDNLGDGANYAFLNDITYVKPKVPTLYSALTTGADAANSAIYGVNTHALVLEHLEVVEIVLNNKDSGKHPFHLHGHNFQVIYRSDDDAGLYDASTLDSADFPDVPMRRDTILAPPGGNVVVRFRADNPGIWLYHCHLVLSPLVSCPSVLTSLL